ncbi:MAG TPA: hypothetical protein VLB27_02360, partial [candidate division Zixibacteria bacterium]|nr:hypothetical protein [candidate division Zixibacteria bacterium]
FADVTGATTRYNRNHYFLWDERYAGTFRILNAHGITMDLSYGPDLEQKGYLFATAFPFHPLDNNGAPFPLWETPVTWTEHFGGADSVWIERILTDNAEIYHGVVSALYHNNTFDWRPDYDTYTSWRRSYQQARRTGHTFFRVSELESFLQARRDSPLDWTLTAGALEVSGDARDGRLALVVPREGLGRPDTDAPVDLITTIDHWYWRVDVPRGPFTLRFPRLEENIRQK